MQEMKYANHCDFYTCGPLPACKNGGGRLPKSLGTPVFDIYGEICFKSVFPYVPE